MNLEEIQAWIKTHRRIDTTYSCPDSSGNDWHTRIYEDKETKQLYAIDFCNEYPLEKLELIGIKPFLSIEGTYPDYRKVKGPNGEILFTEPRKVTRKTRMIEETYYE